MSYTDRELIEALLKFKQESGQFPSLRDFGARQNLPSKNTYYRAFGSLENAVDRAIAFDRGEPDNAGQIKHRNRQTRTISRGMECPFCGGFVDKISAYYSSLVSILSSRFVGLLKSANDNGYINGILDCIHAVFGPENPVIKNALLKAGFLGLFEDRHKKPPKGISE
jgi:hypothetical protein